MPAPKPISKDTLKALYWGETLSVREVAERLGRPTENVRLWMKRQGVPRRSSADGTRLAERKGLINHHRPTGSENPRWKGGIYTRPDGYVLKHCPEHPRAGIRGYVLQHVLVWEKSHGRPVPEGWLVHHLNGIKDDNREENLAAIPRKLHSTTTLLRICRERIRKLEGKIRRLQATKRLL